MTTAHNATEPMYEVWSWDGKVAQVALEEAMAIADIKCFRVIHPAAKGDGFCVDKTGMSPSEIEWLTSARDNFIDALDQRA